MVVQQNIYRAGKWQEISANSEAPNSYALALVFGDINDVKSPFLHKHIRALYPVADIIVASTSGEILGDRVFENSVVVTGVSFSKTKVRSVQKNLFDYSSSFELGNDLFNALDTADLAGIFIVSDGQIVNGSELVDGLNKANVNNVPITGGLAGDNGVFSRTATGLNEMPGEGNVIGVGFYGKNFAMGHGHWAGWDEFGRERTITRSEKNVLYEIDGQSALGLYKEYLGKHAAALPGSALLFPLSISTEDKNGKLVRTILSINEDENSMTFAGNMPVGSKVRLMKASFDKLIEGVYEATSLLVDQFKNEKPQLSILMSCVGRKLVLKQRVAEEVEAACAEFGPEVAVTGFYSNGEISPIFIGSECELHNQTMTLTSFCEF
jgi:hypothetical protein